jgi:dienelactone hydrolase
MRRVAIIFCVFLISCAAIPTPAERKAFADTLANGHNWHATSLIEDKFDLTAYLPRDIRQADSLTVYIEGDGFAWITASRPSADPTPRQPLALQLALAQPEGNAAYLARPCQFLAAAAANCSSAYWTDMRFAPEVITATDQAIDDLKRRYAATRLTLVGYSGGGAVAALVAARRTDVRTLVTVAGNLDHRAWTSLHRVRPLSGSLDPVDEIEKLQGVRQVHLAGSLDENITPELVLDFAHLFPARQRPLVIVEPGFDHQCCWVEQWPAIWRAHILAQESMTSTDPHRTR